MVDGEAPHVSPLPVLKTGGGGRLGRGCSSALTPALSLAGEGVRAGACPLSVSPRGERLKGLPPGGRGRREGAHRGRPYGRDGFPLGRE